MTTFLFDTELTHREAGQIIEAAWIRMPVVEDLAGPSDRIDLNPAARYIQFEQRYLPEKPISFGALAVHNILPSELTSCPPSASFELPADVEYLVGHSIDTDWEAAGSPKHVKRICTYAIAQHLFDECDGKSLNALLYFTGGPIDMIRQRVRSSHSALADCWNVHFLLGHILAKRPDITTWAHLHALSEECRLPLRMPNGRNRGMLLTECETSELQWYLRQDWIDPYFRKGLERVIDGRYQSATRFPHHEDEDDDDYEVERQAQSC